MKKALDLVLFCYLLFLVPSVSAQTPAEEYETLEARRIEKAKSTEKAIESFIAENLKKYSLDPTTVNAIRTNAEKEGLPKQDIDMLLLSAKKGQLRKLYFQQYPAELKNYKATPLTDALRFTCVNGDFESLTNPTLGYTLNSDRLDRAEMSACSTPAIVNNATTAATNLFYDAPVSIIKSGAPGYVQFEPELNAPWMGNVQVPTIGGGTQSIKLNGSGGGNDVTTMTRELTVNDPTFEYRFSLLLEDGGTDHSINEKPFFRVNIISNGQVVFTRCINALPNCLFQKVHDNRLPPWSTGQDIYYTGWVCDEINVAQFMGQQITIEFTIGDCSITQHFGTVYIDDVCNRTCSAPVFGSMVINPLEDCISSINDQYQVCGSFTPPANATLTGATVSISKNGGSYSPVSNAVLQVTGNTFCFTLPSSAFGTVSNGDTYQFQVVVTYTQNCNTITSTNSNVAFGMVTFTANCGCEPNLLLINPDHNVNNNDPLLDKRQVINWVRASNRITFGNSNSNDGVVYKAGDFIELNPENPGVPGTSGFETDANAQFAAYIDPCPGTFNYRPVHSAVTQATGNLIKLNKIDSEKSLLIYPNPTLNKVEIVMQKVRFKGVEIRSGEGRRMLQTNFAGTNKLEVDIGAYTPGIYIVIVTTETGQRYSEKLIKN